MGSHTDTTLAVTVRQPENTFSGTLTCYRGTMTQRRHQAPDKHRDTHPQLYGSQIPRDGAWNDPWRHGQAAPNYGHLETWGNWQTDPC